MKLKKKIIVLSVIVLLFLLAGYLLLTFTNATKAHAEQTAQSFFAENYSDFGEVIEFECSPAMTSHYTFPWAITRSYTAVFVNANNDTVRIEISSYWPFSVFANKKFVVKL